MTLKYKKISLKPCSGYDRSSFTQPLIQGESEKTHCRIHLDRIKEGILVGISIDPEV